MSLLRRRGLQVCDYCIYLVRHRTPRGQRIPYSELTRSFWKGASAALVLGFVVETCMWIPRMLIEIYHTGECKSEIVFSTLAELATLLVIGLLLQGQAYRFAMPSLLATESHFRTRERASIALRQMPDSSKIISSV